MVMKKYRSERKGRRCFDAAIESGTAALAAMEMRRTPNPVVCATGLVRQPHYLSYFSGPQQGLYFDYRGG